MIEPPEPETIPTPSHTPLQSASVVETSTATTGGGGAARVTDKLTEQPLLSVTVTL